jgi:hypothetical protein
LNLEILKFPKTPKSEVVSKDPVIHALNFVKKDAENGTLKNVVIVVVDKQGNIYNTSSRLTPGEKLLLLERAKAQIVESYDKRKGQWAE